MTGWRSRASFGWVLVLASLGLCEAREFRILKKLSVPENPHGIAFSLDRQEVYLVSTRGETLTVLDYATDSVQRRFELSDLPIGIVASPDGRHGVVSHFGADRLSLIDLRSGEIVETRKVGSHPTLFALSKDGRRAFVSCEQDSRVYEIALEPFEVLGSFPTGARPFPPALSRDGRWLFVPSYDEGVVTIIDLLLRNVDETVRVGKKPSGGVMLPDDKHFAVVNRGSNRIDFLNVHTQEIGMALGNGLGNEPFSMVLSPNGSLGFVNNVASASVSILDADKLSVLSQIRTGEQPIVMAVDPTGRKLYVSCEGTHELYVVSIPDKWVTPS